MTATKTVKTNAEFRDFETSANTLLQTAAQNLGGFTVNQNYDPEILDYRRMNTIFWQLIRSNNKKYARSPVIQKIENNSRPVIDFVPRDNLGAVTMTTKEDLQRDLSDPGQPVKALTGGLEFSHFARSMSEQQGRPYGDEVATDTDSLLKETYRKLEMSLFSGNATLNPLEFNGLQQQVVNPNQIIEVDITGANPESIWTAINTAVVRAKTQIERMQEVTHIFSSGPAYVALQEEVRRDTLRWESKEVLPGVYFNSLLTGDGEKPIIPTPYLSPRLNEGGADILSFWLVDIDAVEWHGVAPFGGSRSLEPQIFDVTRYISNQYLLEQRLVVLYGTPYLKNDGLWRIDIRAPLGSAWL